MNTTNVPRRLNTGRKASSSPAHDPGKIIHREGSDTTRPGSDRHAERPTAPRAAGHHATVPDAPNPQTRTAVTARITTHVKQGWPHLGEPVVTFRGQFCYVAARLPGHRQPSPILRLRYQGSPERWTIGIYLASDERYSETELPTSFGPKIGTPEQGIDHTFILYAGPSRQP